MTARHFRRLETSDWWIWTGGRNGDRSKHRHSFNVLERNGIEGVDILPLRRYGRRLSLPALLLTCVFRDSSRPWYTTVDGNERVKEEAGRTLKYEGCQRPWVQDNDP